MGNNGPKWFTPAKTILLTGAGFTHNFGGYLASGMWAVILNHPEIRKYPKLRGLMLEEMNYETIYDEVLRKQEYDNGPERDALQEAIRNAYQQLHEAICLDDNRHLTSTTEVCKMFISRFAGSQRTLGFFFTLNQDLFIERYYMKTMLKIPGLHHPNWFNGRLARKLGEEDRVKLPNNEIVNEMKEEFWKKSSIPLVYIKLHGSHGWKVADGRDVMVIGHAKTEIINNEPLLKWYLSLFREVLQEPERNLVVIGYGFGDKYINDIIVDAIRNRKLRLYVVSPMQPKDFRDMLLPVHSASQTSTPNGEALWYGLFGYYQNRVTDFYHENENKLKPKGEALFRDLGLI